MSQAKYPEILASCCRAGYLTGPASLIFAVWRQSGASGDRRHHRARAQMGSWRPFVRFRWTGLKRAAYALTAKLVSISWWLSLSEW